MSQKTYERNDLRKENEEERGYREAFKILDSDGDGRIGRSAYASVLWLLGDEEQQCEGDGADYDDFKNRMRLILLERRQPDLKHQLENAFSVFGGEIKDQDDKQRKYIAVDTLECVLGHLGDPLTPDETAAFLAMSRDVAEIPLEKGGDLLIDYVKLVKEIW